jgi:predicted house-cleaning NTP pyrophosphatase (Maf/HAM1 superfamily)
MTGICLFNPTTNRTQTSVETYTVKFRNLTDTQIENYLQREQPYDCAGSFKSEGLGICLFEQLEGNDPNTLIGLPLIALTRMLANEGIDPLDQSASFSQESN